MSYGVCGWHVQTKSKQTGNCANDLADYSTPLASLQLYVKKKRGGHGYGNTRVSGTEPSTLLTIRSADTLRRDSTTRAYSHD